MGKNNPELAQALITAAVVGGVAFATAPAGFGLAPAIIATSSILINYLLRPGPEKGLARAPSTRTIRAATSPARWVIGRAKVGGNLVWLAEKDKKLWLALVLSEGACDGIEKIYINGEAVELTRVADSDGDRLTPAGRFENRLLIREYFRADGAQGEAARAAALEADGLPWTTGHRLQNLSWVLVELTQNSYSGDDVSSRFWSGIPDLQFLMRGIKYVNPANAAPAWSSNAADAAYWWLTARRGIPADEIDEPAFFAARALCDDPPPARSEGRYQADGVVSSDDDAVEIERHFAIAMAGLIVEYDGKHVIRPGADRPSMLTIGVDDIIAEPNVSTAPPLAERINSVNATLAADRFADWGETGLPPIRQEPAIAKDGEELASDLGALRFVTRASHAYHLIRIALRQAAAPLTLDIVCQPGEQLDLAELVPGDKVAVDLPEYGFDGKAFMVQRIEINQDWRVSLRLAEWPDDLYDASYNLPDMSARVFSVPRPVAPVENLAAAVEFGIADDGTLEIAAAVSWDLASRNYVSLRLEGPAGKALTAITSTNTSRIAGLSVGSWTINATAVSFDGRASAPVMITLNIVNADIPAPPIPQILEFRQLGQFLRIAFAFEPTRSVAGVEVRYASAAIGDKTELAALDDEAKWAAADRLALSAIVAGRDDEPIVARFFIEETARYRLFARYANRAGTLSPIAEIGEITLARPIGDIWSLSSWPGWAGEKRALERWDHSPAGEPQFPLVPAGGANLVFITAQQFNNHTGGSWPFGSQAFTTDYRTPPLDLEAVRQTRIHADVQLFHPPRADGSGYTRADLEALVNLYIETRNDPSDPWLETALEFRGETVLTARHLRLKIMMVTQPTVAVLRASFVAEEH